MRMVSISLMAMATLAVAIPANVAVRFSPNGGCRDMVAQQLRSARRSIDVAIYTFTAAPLAAVLDSAARRGVKVRVVMDKSQASSPYAIAKTLAQKVPVRIGNGNGLMHDKFAIIDDSVTVTGSYNWTDAAELRNDENLLVIASRDIARAYDERFGMIWTCALPESILAAAAEVEAKGAPTYNTQPKVTPSPSKTSTPGDGDAVYVTESGKKYHRAGCGSLSKSCIPITRSKAKSNGYSSCPRCNP